MINEKLINSLQRQIDKLTEDIYYVKYEVSINVLQKERDNCIRILDDYKRSVLNDSKRYD